MNETNGIKRPRLLIVGLNYAPEVTGIAPYTTGAARHLADEHVDVTVLTGYPHYPAWEVLPEHRNLPDRGEEKGVHLRRLRHYVPKKPNPAGRIGLEISFALKVLLARWDKPDVILCVSPSLLSTAAALFRAKVMHRRTASAIWVQDLYSKGLKETTNAPSSVTNLATHFEGLILRQADHTVVIHDRFHNTVTSALKVKPEKISVVRNWTHVSLPPSHDVASTRKVHGWKSDETVVLHAGNMGAKQGLENVVAAARLADSKDEPIRFVLLGDGNQRKTLEEEAKEVERIQFIDPLDDENFGAALSAADILLLNENPSVADMAVPSKLTTYFAAGKPVIAATDSGSASAEEIRASGGGILVSAGNPDELLSATLALRADTALRDSLARSGVKYRETKLGSDASLGILTQVINGLTQRNSK